MRQVPSFSRVRERWEAQVFRRKWKSQQPSCLSTMRQRWQLGLMMVLKGFHHCCSQPAIEDKGHGSPHPPPCLTPLITNLPTQLAETPAQTV